MVIPERVEGRKVHWAGTMTVREESVLLWLYDDLRYDGDTVSVFVNGQCVAHRIEVPHRKQPRALRVHLQPGTNHLVMHAENEGREAPNTAGMLVRTKGKKHCLVMRSTMNHSAGLLNAPRERLNGPRAGTRWTLVPKNASSSIACSPA
ncbi:MAG: hypothetical protein IPG11_17995 [Flavobacteriales bacterium]|nr:hypothetical protein [Flavobacteriales bacterium]